MPSPHLKLWYSASALLQGIVKEWKYHTFLGNDTSFCLLAEAKREIRMGCSTDLLLPMFYPQHRQKNPVFFSEEEVASILQVPSNGNETHYSNLLGEWAQTDITSVYRLGEYPFLPNTALCLIAKCCTTCHSQLCHFPPTVHSIYVLNHRHQFLLNISEPSYS